MRDLRARTRSSPARPRSRSPTWPVWSMAWTTSISLVDLLDDLLQRLGVAAAGDGHARELAVGDVGADDQALDVVAAPREHQRDAHQHAGLVAHQHRDGVQRRASAHRATCGRVPLSMLPLPDMTRCSLSGLAIFCFGRSMIMSRSARAGRDHREDVVLLDHLGLDEAGAVVVVHRRLQHAVDLGGALDAPALDAVGARPA